MTQRGTTATGIAVADRLKLHRLRGWGASRDGAGGQGGDTMTRRSLSGLKVAVSTLALLAVPLSAAHAQDDVEDEAGVADGIVMEAIVVTATRREERLQDVPFAITAVDPDDYRSSGVLNTKDVVDFVPGIDFVPFAGGPGGTGAIIARGINQDAISTPVVSVYVDDLSITSTSFLSSANYVDLFLLDIERVEFLKGPQGTLYGSNAIAGAVRYITRKPSLDGFRAFASANLSTTKDGGFNQTYRAQLSAPIIEDKLGLTVTGFYDAYGGLLDAVDADGALLREDGDDHDRFGVSADLYFTPTDKLDLRFNYIRQDMDFAALRASSVSTDTDGVPLFGRFDAIVDPDSTQAHAFEMFAGTASYDFGWAVLTSVTGHSELLIERDENTLSLAPLVDIRFDLPPGTTTSVPLAGDTPTERFVQELRLTSAENGTFEWIFGVFYADEKTTDRRTVTGQPDDNLLFDRDLNAAFEEIAGYLDVRYYLTPKLDVSAGFRISSQKTEFVEELLFVPNDTFTDAQTSAVTDTYAFGFRYRPSNGVSVYGRVASGFRPPISQASVVIGGIETDRDIESDTVWSYELGAKGNFAGGSGSFDVALFYADWDAFQARILDPVGGAFNANAPGGITIKGIEAAVGLRPVDGLSIDTTVAFTDSALADDTPEVFGLEGQQTPNVPKWTASARARYDFAIATLADAYVGGGVRYSGPRRSAFQDDNPAVPEFNLTSDDYVLVDVSAGVSRGHISVDFYVKNLFDEYEFFFARSTPARGTFVGNVAPRTIGGTVTLDF